MAMHYYSKTTPAAHSPFSCDGCGAVMAFYRIPVTLFYGAEH